MKSSEEMKDGARPSGEASLEALSLRIARLEAELERRDREAESEASGDVYPAVLTLGAKLKGVHERLVNLQKQSGDILESLGRRVDHVEAEMRSGDGSERLRQVEQKVQHLGSLESLVGNLEQKVQQLGSLESLVGNLEQKVQQLGSLESLVGNLEQKIRQVETLESALGSLEQRTGQVQNDAQERLTALTAAVTRLQNLSTEQNLRGDEIRRWFEPLKSLPNAVSDIRQMGLVRERLEKLEKIFRLAEGPESEAVRQQIEACGGWPGALAAIAKFRELQDDLRQMRDERLQEQVVALGDQIAGLRHLADPHGGWEFILNAVSRLKEQLEALRRGCDEALRRVESTDKGLHDMVHLADPHGGWLHSLEALARSKEIHPYLEELRAIDIAKRAAALPYQMEDLARKSQQVSDRLKEIEEGLEKMLHWADPHGGWEHTLQTTARFKENLEFLAKVRSIDFNALGDFFNTLKRENLVLRMKRLERMLHDLEKTYRVQEMLDKFKSEQRLLLE